MRHFERTNQFGNIYLLTRNVSNIHRKKFDFYKQSNNLVSIIIIIAEIEVHTGKILQASRNHGDLVLSFIANFVQAIKDIAQRTKKFHTDMLTACYLNCCTQLLHFIL